MKASLKNKDATMRAVKVRVTFFGLIASALVACSAQSDYEKYSSCLLDSMKGQDRSMKSLAEDNCELKHPYERNIRYWRNDIELSFSIDPAQDKVLFREKQNKSDFRLTKIEVSGHYLTCEKIPKVPEKHPSFLTHQYYNAARAKLGITDNKPDYKRTIQERSLIIEKAEAIKSAEDQGREATYQAALKKYNDAESSWSSPIEVKFKNGSGEIEISKFIQVTSNSTMDSVKWQRGPGCIRYIEVRGRRYR